MKTRICIVAKVGRIHETGVLAALTFEIEATWQPMVYGQEVPSQLPLDILDIMFADESGDQRRFSYGGPSPEGDPLLVPLTSPTRHFEGQHDLLRQLLAVGLDAKNSATVIHIVARAIEASARLGA